MENLNKIYKPPGYSFGVGIKSNFGVTKETLNTFSYQNLESIYYGIFNFDESSIYPYLNPTEMLGLLHSVGKKDHGYSQKLQKQIFQSNLFPVLFFKEFAAGLINNGRYALFGYDLDKESLESKLEQLPGNVVEKSIKAFEREKRYSNKENSEITDFADPNIDGSEKHIYVNDIYNHFAREYGAFKKSPAFLPQQ